MVLTFLKVLLLLVTHNCGALAFCFGSGIAHQKILRGSLAHTQAYDLAGAFLDLGVDMLLYLSAPLFRMPPPIPEEEADVSCILPVNEFVISPNWAFYTRNWGRVRVSHRLAPTGHLQWRTVAAGFIFRNCGLLIFSSRSAAADS